MLKDWNWRTPITDTLNLDENKCGLQVDLGMKEKALPETQIRSMHEMEEMKRAQELRVDEFSVQRVERECHETIQRLTLQVQELQEKMIFNDSGEFQEIELILCGKCSHVPNQPARISSPRSMLSCDKRLRHETWNAPGLQEHVFANPRSTLESLQIPYRRIHQFFRHQVLQVRFRCSSAQGNLWQEKMKE